MSNSFTRFLAPLTDLVKREVDRYGTLAPVSLMIRPGDLRPAGLRLAWSLSLLLLGSVGIYLVYQEGILAPAIPARSAVSLVVMVGLLLVLTQNVWVSLVDRPVRFSTVQHRGFSAGLLRTLIWAGLLTVVYVDASHSIFNNKPLMMGVMLWLMAHVMLIFFLVPLIAATLHVLLLWRHVRIVGYLDQRRYHPGDRVHFRMTDGRSRHSAPELLVRLQFVEQRYDGKLRTRRASHAYATTVTPNQLDQRGVHLQLVLPSEPGTLLTNLRNERRYEFWEILVGEADQPPLARFLVDVRQP